MGMSALLWIIKAAVTCASKSALMLLPFKISSMVQSFRKVSSGVAAIPHCTHVLKRGNTSTTDVVPAPREAVPLNQCYAEFLNNPLIIAENDATDAAFELACGSSSCVIQSVCFAEPMDGDFVPLV